MEKAQPSYHEARFALMGGPPTFDGLAGTGTLVTYGDESNDCRELKLQFDAGRGTNVRLSEVGVAPAQLDAIFFTHLHSDHTDDVPDIVFNAWRIGGGGEAVGHCLQCRCRCVSRAYDELREFFNQHRRSFRRLG